MLNLIVISTKAWDDIEIEDELGNSEPVQEVQLIKSKLNVPLVCSPLIQTILYTLCQELTKHLAYNMIE